MRVAKLWLPGVLVLGVGWALWRGMEREAEPPGEPTGFVVEVDGERFGAEALASHLGREPRFTSSGEASLAVSRFAMDKLLEAHARRLGIAADEVVRHLLESGPGPEPVGEQDIAAFYRANLERYRHPRKVAFVYAVVPPTGDPESTRRKIASIRTRAQIHSRPDGLRYWIPARMRGAFAAETGMLPCDDSRLGDHDPPREIVDAACGMRRGTLSAPLEHRGAWYVLRVQSTQRPSALSLHLVRDDIRGVLEARARDAAHEAVVERLRQESGLVVSWPDVARLIHDAPPAPRREGGPPRPPGRSEG